MAFSIQTNVNSLVAQENLRVNGDFQSRTINRLTSGYRINSSGDDAAGLAVANKYRSDIAELQQGVRNANDGISALQIIDGGLNNVSKMLDRLKTLATQSASNTFTGNRNTLNDEYKALLGEIDRQAANIGLGTGDAQAARYNRSISVYTGGGSAQGNAKVSIDLSAGSDRVNSTGLGISGTSVDGSTRASVVGDADLSSATGLLAGGETQQFTVTTANDSISFTLTGDSDGFTGQEVVDAMNQRLSAYGISASLNNSTGASAGKLQLASSEAFTFDAMAASDTTAGVRIMAATASAVGNTGMYNHSATLATVAGTATHTTTVSFTNASGAQIGNAVTLTVGDTADDVYDALSTALEGTSISVLRDGSTVYFQSSEDFSYSRDDGGDTITNAGLSTLAADAAVANPADPSGDADVTSAGLNAITKITEAVTKLGTVQGKVGTAQNKLQYAIQLAQSQISNFSGAESRIRDADVAAEAANLTKAQVLQQASLAAMAQANTAPQAVMALLRG